MKWMGAMIFAVLLVLWPERALQAAQRAMYTWVFSVAPVLFPFMAVVPALTAPDALKLYERAAGRIFSAVFGVPSSAGGAITTALMAGSPAGANALMRTMMQERYTHADAVRCAALVTGCSPIFLLSGVGSGMLSSQAAGIVLVCVQIGAVFFTGVFLRFWPLTKEKAPVPAASDARDPVQAVLNVCGSMVLFSVGMEFVTVPLKGALKTVILAAGEIALGMQAVREYPLPVLAAVAGFSGMCILWQNASCLRACGISFGVLLCIKFLHALFAFVLCGIWMHIAGSTPCFAGVGEVSFKSSVPYALLLMGISLAAGYKKAARRLLQSVKKVFLPSLWTGK
ncbi:MAG: hypothetical protein E7335_05540 [Clostridiales bacterium]|nr:hypothetical protein [Clostridiales bacterium]